MSLRTLYRTLIILWPLLLLINFAYDQLAQPYLSEDWRTLLEWSGDGGWPPEDFADQQTTTSAVIWFLIVVLLLVAVVVIQIGLFFFKG